MSNAEEAEGGSDYEFKWGKKSHYDSTLKAQFYESFTFDGVEYFLYDCVYLYKEDEPEPYIGKIVKIFDNLIYRKQLKVVWFFQPEEILNFLGNIVPLEKEIFLACGEGVGLANFNSLEAIAGKCNVVCTSQDKRNPQPSEEELQMADYIFYRTFDVAKRTISYRFEADKIAGTEVKNYFNKIKHRELTRDNPESKGEELNQPKSSGFEKDWVGYPTTQTKDKANISPAVKSEGSNPSIIRKPRIKSLDYRNAYGSHARTSEREENIGRSRQIKNEHEGNAEGSHGRISKHEKVRESYVRTFEHEGSNVGESRGVRIESEKNVAGQEREGFRQASHPGLMIEKTITKTEYPKMEKPESSKNMTKKRGIDSIGHDEGGVFSTLNIGIKSIKLTDKKVIEPSPGKVIKTESHTVEIKQKQIDTKKWFKELPWEERMDHAHTKGSLVQLQNLDPYYTSSQIEDLVFSAFKLNCSAKMLQQTGISSPHNGKALVIFKTKEAADMVVDKLRIECLMLPDGRPLIAKIATPRVPQKPTKFIGHLTIDKFDLQNKRKQAEAVSTSHYSQPNTIEHDLAVEWCLLQKRAEESLRVLYKEHGDQLAALKAQLKRL